MKIHIIAFNVMILSNYFLLGNDNKLIDILVNDYAPCHIPITIYSLMLSHIFMSQKEIPYPKRVKATAS